LPIVELQAGAGAQGPARQPGHHARRRRPGPGAQGRRRRRALPEGGRGEGQGRGEGEGCAERQAGRPARRPGGTQEEEEEGRMSTPARRPPTSPPAPHHPPGPPMPGRINYAFRTAVWGGGVLLALWGAWRIQSMINAHEREMEEAQETITGLRGDVAARDAHISELDAQVAELKAEVQRLQ